MAERGRGSMAPSKAFMYHKANRNQTTDPTNYMNKGISVPSTSSNSKLDRNGNLIPTTVL